MGEKGLEVSVEVTGLKVQAVPWNCLWIGFVVGLFDCPRLFGRIMSEHSYDWYCKQSIRMGFMWFVGVANGHWVGHRTPLGEVWISRSIQRNACRVLNVWLSAAAERWRNLIWDAISLWWNNSPPCFVLNQYLIKNIKREDEDPDETAEMAEREHQLKMQVLSQKMMNINQDDINNMCLLLKLEQTKYHSQQFIFFHGWPQMKYRIHLAIVPHWQSVVTTYILDK